MDAAGMTLERVVAEHLIPSLDATKTIYSKRRGQVMQRCRVPDLWARFRALKLMTELRFEMANRQSQTEASNEPTFKLIKMERATISVKMHKNPSRSERRIAN